MNIQAENEIICSNTLEIIQGDTFDLEIELEDVDVLTIDKIIFSSATLNVKYEAQWSDEENVYLVSLTAKDTAEFEPMKASYDITVLFVNNKVSTARYNGVLIVKEKVNEI